MSCNLTFVIGCIGVNKILPEYCSNVWNLLNSIPIKRTSHSVCIRWDEKCISISSKAFLRKTAEELMKIDAADKENHLEMRNIDFGVNVKEQVSWSL